MNVPLIGYVMNTTSVKTFTKNNSRQYKRSYVMLKHCIALSLIALLASGLTGCATANPEVRYTNVKPKVPPLSENVLDAMQPNSTDLLKRADDWLLNSGLLLDSVTNN